jgi:hypothetical protein
MPGGTLRIEAGPAHRFPPGEALIDAVPETDLVLADVPAEQDVLALPARREVEEALVEVLDEHARRLNPLDDACQCAGRLFQLRVGLCEVRRSQIAAVSRDLPTELGAERLRLDQQLSALNHLLGERAKLGEGVVRLVEREVAPGRHGRMIRLVVPTGQRVRPVLDLFLWSRAAIWAAVVFAYLAFEPNRHPRASRWDIPELTRESGYVIDVWARWDSVWFLRLAHDGYGGTEQAAAAFYPLYPLLTGVLGRVLFGHYLLAGVLISLAAALGAFVLLYQLAEPRLGPAGARRTVLYLAVFPFALFLQAVYSESLFLLLVLASFLLAERGSFLGAGVAAGLAWLTRPVGIALLPALALIAWRAPNRGGALLRLLAAPAVFALYPLWLWWRFGDPFEFRDAEKYWGRELSSLGPLGGLWDGLRAGWAGVRQLASGSHTERFWSAVQDTDPMRVAIINLENLVFLALFAALTVIAWRRFGAPYGLYATLSLLIPLSVPGERWPLNSMPRFGLALFPIFLALATLGERPRVHTAIVTISAVLLGVACVQWALWQWVA